MRIRKRLSIPLLISFVALSYTLLQPVDLIPERAGANVQPSAARTPESYAMNVVMRDFSSTGSLLDETTAQALRRFKTGEFTELDEPQRTGYDGDSQWLASAHNGILRERQETLELTGEVRLRYLGEAVEFATQSMLLNLNKRTAVSNAPVRISQNDNYTDADQLFAELDRQRATLRGSVKTRYATQN